MIKVAILGFGVVGSGVAEVIDKNAKTISEKAKNNIEVKYILDVRDFPDSPYGDKIVHDFGVIENDPEVQIVVETIGGKTFAYDFTKRALLAGKSVVTSNKELVAEHGAELLKIAKERNINYLFEASVGGGIPILRPLTQCLSANNINEICGILNGTTNYILTKMIKDNVSFENALKEAQQKGYAEQDPTADIEGFDACRKICILADLAYGKNVSPSLVQTEGITKITLRDVEYAKAYNCVIKLIGRVKKNEEQINILVAPHLVSNESLISSVEDVFNGIMVDGDAVGNVMFYGRGAGKLPTASAVVADVIDVAKHLEARKYIGWDEAADGFVADSNDMEYKFMIRVSVGGEKLDVEKEFPGAEVLPKLYDDDMAFVTAYEKTGDILDKLDKLKNKGYNVLSAIRVL